MFQIIRFVIAAKLLFFFKEIKLNNCGTVTVANIYIGVFSRRKLTVNPKKSVLCELLFIKAVIRIFTSSSGKRKSHSYHICSGSYRPPRYRVIPQSLALSRLSIFRSLA